VASIAPYIHPVSGGLILALLMYVGALGLRARNDRRRAAPLLRQHARWAPLVFALNGVSWLGGTVSTWLLRRDLDLFASAHFRIGSALLLALLLSWISSRRMHLAAVRNLHPWFGAAAMLLAAAQVFFGLQITP
jgi:hypothetical protein